MKRELCALGLLLMLGAACLLHLSVLTELLRDVDEQITASEAALLSGDREEAERALARAEKRWEDADDYTHALLRQSETDAVAGMLTRLKEALAAGERERAGILYAALHSSLSDVRRWESPKISSIF